MAVERSQEAGRHTERRDDVLVPVAHGVEHRAPGLGAEQPGLVRDRTL